MLKNIFLWIIQNVFKIKTETEQKEVDKNQEYARDYEDIKSINFNAIFSNKLANYVMSDSELSIEGENARVELLNKTGQSMWKNFKKIVSMGFGYGGIVLVPYVKGGKLYYSKVPQNRLTIDETDGDLITGATILAEIKTITGTIKTTKYFRWTNYKIENNNLTITQQFTDENGNPIPVPDFWANIQQVQVITNVDRALFGYIQSPINNRRSNDKYGVPITFGCEETILEIRECLQQIQREFKLKECFVGADSTMFDGKDGLPKNGIFRKVDSGEDGFFEVFDPAIRESSYYARLQELYKRLEHEIGTSAGILSDVQTQNATATEIKRSMYDTFTIVDDMRSSIEKGLEDFFYACNVLANAYSLSPMGEYELSFNWSYTLLEDTQQEFNQLIQGKNQGVIEKAELRQWLKPNETLEEAREKIAEIEANEPSIKDLLGE